MQSLGLPKCGAHSGPSSVHVPSVPLFFLSPAQLIIEDAKRRYSISEEEYTTRSRLLGLFIHGNLNIKGKYSMNYETPSI